MYHFQFSLVNLNFYNLSHLGLTLIYFIQTQGTESNVGSVEVTETPSAPTPSTTPRSPSRTASPRRRRSTYPASRPPCAGRSARKVKVVRWEYKEINGVGTDNPIFLLHLHAISNIFSFPSQWRMAILQILCISGRTRCWQRWKVCAKFIKWQFCWPVRLCTMNVHAQS